MKEIWKDIEGYEGIYQVSNLGRVKTLAREFHRKNKWGGIDTLYTKEKLTSIWKASNTKNQYLMVTLHNPKTQTEDKKYVHKLVAHTFLPESIEDKAIIFKDGNCQNVRVDNLQVSDTPNADYKLNGNAVYFINTKDNKVFNSITQAAKLYGLTKDKMSRQINTCDFWTRGDYTEAQSNAIWKPVKDFPGYEINNYGSLRSLPKCYTNSIGQKRVHTGYYLKPRICADATRKQPNLIVSLTKDGRKFNRDISHLLIDSFCPQPDYYRVTYKDNNPLNCKLTNLEIHPIQKRKPNNKYQDIRKQSGIMILYKPTNQIFISIKEASRQLGISVYKLTKDFKGEQCLICAYNDNQIINGISNKERIDNYQNSVQLRQLLSKPKG